MKVGNLFKFYYIGVEFGCSLAVGREVWVCHLVKQGLGKETGV